MVADFFFIDRLRQIIVNLLNNSVKFSGEGEIVLSASCSTNNEGKRELIVSVRDQGIGISEEAKERIFQPFIQADTSTTRKFVSHNRSSLLSPHSLRISLVSCFLRLFLFVSFIFSVCREALD